MRRSPFVKVGMLLLPLVLIFAGCGDDDDGDGGNGGNGGEEESSETLVIGRVLPDTGPLSFLGPPMIEGFELAIADINEAGGVLGGDVETVEADEGETPAVAREGASRLLNEGAHAIIGAAASGSSQEFIQVLYDAQIPQCSGSNTSPAFTDQDNAGYYFRTVPPDEAVAPIIADTVIADGHEKVAVVARADDYGNALGELVKTGLEEAGAEVPDLISYDPEAGNFSAEVSAVTAESPDAVVLVSFDEGGQILAGLLEAGLSADQFYGSDGVFGPTFPAQVSEDDPNIIDGMKVIGAAGNEEFNDRIAEPTDNNFIYGGQTYDCVIITALAAHAAGAVDGDSIIGEIANVTSGGTKCTTFAECKELLDEGEDIDYDGASGPIELDDAGDPQSGLYAIGQFTEGAIEILSSQEVDLADI